MYKYLIGFLWGLLPLIGFTQQIIKGIVLDKNENTPLENVHIIDNVSGKWAITDKSGNFSIKLKTNFNLTFSILGKKDFILHSKDYSPNMTIYMSDETLKLQDVIVTATQEKNQITSSVVLNKYAISQFQSFSLSDILQQLPGQTISSSKLTQPKVIENIRTAITDKNNGFGLTYIIDNMPFSNDENMQSYNGKSPITLNSTINSGIDLRTIPTSNIEKIEVITGIPDAKYGNTTTGLVIVERQAGVFPLKISGQIQKGSQSIALNKGFLLNNKVGKLSLSLDFLDAKENPTNSLKGYKRISLSGIWTYEKENRFKNSLSVSLRSNLDNDKEDKEYAPNLRDKNSRTDYGLTISNKASWQLNLSWINRLLLQSGISYSYTNEIKEWFTNNGGAIIPLANTTSLHKGGYTPVSYLAKTQVIGEPFHMNFQLSAEKHFRTSYWNHLISAGIAYNHSDNLGEGKIYDTDNAHSIATLSRNITSKEGIRGLNFNRNVVPSKQLAVYMQDELSYELKNQQKIHLKLGVRYENQNGFSSISPRINTAYEIASYLKIRSGIGLTTKAPSLVNMFPGNMHFDVLLKDIRTNEYAFNLVQTFVEPRSRVNLRPSKSWKYEIGTDLNNRWGRLSVTAFYNHLYDGFFNETIFKSYLLPDINVIPPLSPSQEPSYTINKYDDFLFKYTQTNNKTSVKDTGIEFLFHSKKIIPINTNFSLSGTYIYTSSKNNSPFYIANTDKLDKQHLYGVYDNQAKKADRMSLRLTATHHIAHLALLISITAEQFTFSNNYGAINDPLAKAYINAKAQEITIAPEQRTHSIYKSLQRNNNIIDNSRVPIYHNFHLRVTKEMINGLSLSLYVVNFLDYQPLVEIGNYTSSKNENISFGINVKYEF